MNFLQFKRCIFIVSIFNCSSILIYINLPQLLNVTLINLFIKQTQYFHKFLICNNLINYQKMPKIKYILNKYKKKIIYEKLI